MKIESIITEYNEESGEWEIADDQEVFDLLFDMVEQSNSGPKETG